MQFNGTRPDQSVWLIPARHLHLSNVLLNDIQLYYMYQSGKLDERSETSFAAKAPFVYIFIYSFLICISVWRFAINAWARGFCLFLSSTVGQRCFINGNFILMFSGLVVAHLSFYDELQNFTCSYFKIVSYTL